MLGNLSLNLMGNVDSDTALILAWPDYFVATLNRRLLAIHSNIELAPDDLADLKTHGLLESTTGEPTALGRYLIDLAVHESWQEGDELESFLQRGAQALAGAVLEVGCSTGWALRSIPQPPPALRVGIDIDAKALAVGYQLAKVEKQEIGFCCCSVHALPFPAQSFDWVICRNALTYAHQRTAMREMIRVLKPGGYLFLRFENIWYDLWNLSHPRGLKPTCATIRDLGYGLIHAAAGWQPVPGSSLCGGRAFGSLRQLTRMLHEGDCTIHCVERARKCPRFMGIANQTSLLARKSP